MLKRKEVREFYSRNYGPNIINYVDSVYKEAIEIDKNLLLSLDKDIILLMSYVHGLHVNNLEEYHSLTGDYVAKGDKFINTLDEKSKKILEMAVREYVTPSSYECFSVYSKIMKMAVTGPPNLKDLMKRYYGQYGSYERVIEHVKDAVKRRVYDSKSLYYRTYYEKEIALFYTDACRLDVEKVRRIVSVDEIGDTREGDTITRNVNKKDKLEKAIEVAISAASSTIVNGVIVFSKGDPYIPLERLIGVADVSVYWDRGGQYWTIQMIPMEKGGTKTITALSPSGREDEIFRHKTGSIGYYRPVFGIIYPTIGQTKWAISVED